MAINPDKLWSSLDSIEKDIIDCIKKYKVLATSAKLIDGEIASKLPLQIQASIDTLTKLVNGQELNSIKNLKAFVDEVPLGSIRDKTLDSDTLDEPPMVSNEDIDMTPRMGAPASQIASQQESFKKDIKKWLKEDGDFKSNAVFDNLEDFDLDEEGKDNGGFYMGGEDSPLDDDYTGMFDNEEEDSLDFDDFEDEEVRSIYETPYEDDEENMEDNFDDDGIGGKSMILNNFDSDYESDYDESDEFEDEESEDNYDFDEEEDEYEGLDADFDFE